jgi:hypothetical protein
VKLYQHFFNKIIGHSMGKNGLDTLEISNPKVLKCILPTCAVYYDDATSEARLDHAPINRPKDP